ncbi:unnamed protein product [Staurois parvus]|uniref:Uncharacterized protein n=1 Tax=Staurois parvus TaxID=386267 RepID=A0ABN9EME9_9NEOB|nr:unnamed protein product [Staurois parvus]
MYINGRTVAVQGRVDVYKLLVRTPWEHAAPLSSGTPIVRPDLCARSRSP